MKALTRKWYNESYDSEVVTMKALTRKWYNESYDSEVVQ